MKISIQQLFIAIVLTTVCATPATFAGKIYKWIDKDGNVQYSATKPSDSAQEMNVHIKPAASEEEEDTQSSTDTGKSEKKEGSREESVKVSNEKEAAEVEKKNAEIRKKNCSISKKRLATINIGGRLYEVDEKGERTYWDNATRASKLAEAQAQVDEWCKDE